MKNSAHLKRAKVTILKKYSLASEHENLANLFWFKTEMSKKIKEFGKFDKKNTDMATIRKEISRIRFDLKQKRVENYLLRIELKNTAFPFSCDVEVSLGAFDNKKGNKFTNMVIDAVNEALRRYRRKLKYEGDAIPFDKTMVVTYGVKRGSRVFKNENTILKLYIKKHIQRLYEDKKPDTNKKFVGIELEFCAPIKRDEFAVKLFQAGIHKFAQLKDDGSLRPHKNEVGYELAILLEERNYKKNLKKVIDVLTSIKAAAEDRRCGLHVHLDIRKRNRDVVYNNLVAAQNALLTIVNPIRYNNEFCKLVTSRKFPTEFTGDRHERYKTINAAAYYKYKTLEVRMHEGSVDYKQISNWVNLLIKIANYPKKFKNQVSKLTSLNKRVNVNKRVMNYLQDRVCYWQVHNGRRDAVTGTELQPMFVHQPAMPTMAMDFETTNAPPLRVPPIERLRRILNQDDNAETERDED